MIIEDYFLATAATVRNYPAPSAARANAWQGKSAIGSAPQAFPGKGSSADSIHCSAIPACINRRNIRLLLYYKPPCYLLSL